MPKLFLALGAAFAVSLGYGLLLVLPLYVAVVGGDEGDFGAVLAAATVPAVAVLLLVARHPRALPSPVLLAGACLGLGAGVVLAAAVTESWLPLVAVGVLVGTAWAVVYTVAPMVVSDLVDDDARVTWLGYLTGSEQLGIGIGPVLAAWLVDEDDYRTAFLVAAVVCVAGAGCALAVGRTTTGTERPPLRLGPAVRRLVSSPVRTYLLLVATFACLFTTMTQFQTTFAADRALDFQVFYVAYTVAVILVRFLVAPWVARFDAATVVAVAITVMAVAVASFLLVGSSAVAYAAASAGLGVGYGIALPAVQAQAVNVAADDLRPTVLPLAGLAFQTMILAFPLVVGWVVVRGGYTTLFVVLVAIAVAQAGAAWAVRARVSRAAAA